MSNRHIHIAIVATSAIVVIGYFLSFGPACWLVETNIVSPDHVMSIYSPLIMYSCNHKNWFADALWKYSCVVSREPNVPFWLFKVEVENRKYPRARPILDVPIP